MNIYFICVIVTKKNNLKNCQNSSQINLNYLCKFHYEPLDLVLHSK